MTKTIDSPTVIEPAKWTDSGIRGGTMAAFMDGSVYEVAIDDDVLMWTGSNYDGFPEFERVSFEEAQRIYSAQEGSTLGETIHARYGASAYMVTNYGVEILTRPYCIPKDRLGETDWIRQIAEKTWGGEAPITAAIKKARSVHGFAL